MITSLRTRAFQIIIHLVILLGMLMVMTAVASAQTGTTAGFKPLVDLPAQSPAKFSGLYSSQDLTTFVNRMFFLMISIGGMLAVGRLSYAGWLYMIGDNFGNLKKAKGIVGNVVIGLLILLSIWLILMQINPYILSTDILQSFSR